MKLEIIKQMLSKLEDCDVSQKTIHEKTGISASFLSELKTGRKKSCSYDKGKLIESVYNHVYKDGKAVHTWSAENEVL